VHGWHPPVVLLMGPQARRLLAPLLGLGASIQIVLKHRPNVCKTDLNCPIRPPFWPDTKQPIEPL
jgi:hypothetical protein